MHASWLPSRHSWSLCTLWRSRLVRSLLPQWRCQSLHFKIKANSRFYFLFGFHQMSYFMFCLCRALKSQLVGWRLGDTSDADSKVSRGLKEEIPSLHRQVVNNKKKTSTCQPQLQKHVMLCGETLKWACRLILRLTRKGFVFHNVVALCFKRGAQ